MKCDELKDRWFWAYPTESVDCDGITGSAHEVYSKPDVDEAIAELKSTYKGSVEVKVKIWERCKKAEDELRKTQRALWLARALRARDKAFEYHFKNNIEMCAKWDNVHLMLMAKSEEYK